METQCVSGKTEANPSSGRVEMHGGSMRFLENEANQSPGGSIINVDNAAQKFTESIEE
jgi:hypothetical protein